MNTQRLKVPNDLSEIRLLDYQKFVKIAEKDQETDFLHKKMIEIFCHIELSDVDKYAYNSIRKVVQVLTDMFDQKPKLKTTLKIHDQDYGFIPKLDDMSFGEYADLDLLIADWQTMDQAMAVLYRPITNKFKNKYIIEDYNSDKTAYMGNITMDYVFGSLFFLTNLNQELSKHILHYSAKMSNKLTRAQKDHFLSNMDSGHPFTQLQKVTY